MCFVRLCRYFLYRCVVADSTYKRVLVIGGGIKETCGHVWIWLRISGMLKVVWSKGMGVRLDELRIIRIHLDCNVCKRR
jgi:hypothetical protein